MAIDLTLPLLFPILIVPLARKYGRKNHRKFKHRNYWRTFAMLYVGLARMIRGGVLAGLWGEGEREECNLGRAQLFSPNFGSSRSRWIPERGLLLKSARHWPTDALETSEWKSPSWNSSLRHFEIYEYRHHFIAQPTGSVPLHCAQLHQWNYASADSLQRDNDGRVFSNDDDHVANDRTWDQSK